MGREGRVVGKVVGTRVEDNELLVSVRLTECVGAREIDRNTSIGGFHYGTPLGTVIEPRFEGTCDNGVIDLSVFDKNVDWASGVLEAQRAQFIGLELTLAK